MTTTPPPPLFIETPATPRHGPKDRLESTPRRSTRLSSRQIPSVGLLSTSRSSSTSTSPGDETPKCPDTPSGHPSPPASPLGSPKSKLKSPCGLHRPVRHSSLAPRSDLFLSRSSSSSTSIPQRNQSQLNTMLPTPAKTPKKARIEDFGSTTRSLFPKSRSLNTHVHFKQNGNEELSLRDSRSSMGKHNRENIGIFVDSRDRIPELHDNEDNPFISRPGETDDTKRRKAKAKTAREKATDEYVNREDGMLYVFRGKKMFRKFEPEVEEDEDEKDSEELLAAFSDAPEFFSVRPLTRSSVKPRVLFPEARKPADKATETSCPRNSDTAADKQTNNTEQSTPSAESQSVFPETPLARGHSSRSHSKKELRVKGLARASPFDAWRRTKSTVSTSMSKFQKRVSGPSEVADEPVPKKPRNK